MEMIEGIICKCEFKIHQFFKLPILQTDWRFLVVIEILLILFHKSFKNGFKKTKRIFLTEIRARSDIYGHEVLKSDYEKGDTLKIL